MCGCVCTRASFTLFSLMDHCTMPAFSLLLSVWLYVSLEMPLCSPEHTVTRTQALNYPECFVVLFVQIYICRVPERAFIYMYMAKTQPKGTPLALLPWRRCLFIFLRWFLAPQSSPLNDHLYPMTKDFFFYLRLTEWNAGQMLWSFHYNQISVSHEHFGVMCSETERTYGVYCVSCAA